MPSPSSHQTQLHQPVQLPMSPPRAQGDLPEGTIRPWLPSNTEQSGPNDTNDTDLQSSSDHANTTLTSPPAPPPGMGYLPVPELTCLHCLGSNPPGKLGYVVSYIPVPLEKIKTAQQAWSGGLSPQSSQTENQRGRTGGLGSNAGRAVSQDRKINGVWQNAVGYDEVQKERRRGRSESQKRYVPEDAEADLDDVVE
ncbi:hypothetical protein IAR55_005624 [Kwoniella newhampshirensis]|uniref:Uncharacterized protein n=1 Tax=Kwoniella newhampshirensis TaxID=1651941 RepID=A0AAW0YVB1_9TREE